MKKLFFITVILGWASLTWAQQKKEYKIKNFQGDVIITGSVGGLIVEGYNGNEVIIEAETTEQKAPDKAKGLMLLTPGGVDNTGLGINIDHSPGSIISDTDKQNGTETLEINIPNENKLFKNYRIKIPNQSNLKIKGDSWAYFAKNATIFINGMAGELEVNCSECNIKVNNFSGNIVSNTTFGETYVEFSKFGASKASYITGSSKDVEVILPADTKANINISSSTGSTYTDFDLEKPNPSKTSDRDEIIVVGKPHWVQGFKSDSPRIQIKEDTIRLFGGASLITQSGKKGNGFVDEELKKELDKINLQVKDIESVSVIKKGVAFKPDYTINGGGSSLSIKTFNGNIYLRKKD